jgi:carboxypeptidase family protein/TIR domain-containing protein
MDNPLPRPGEPPGPLGPVAVPEAGKLPAKRFRVALTFSGDKRDFIAQIASILANHFSEAEILYDKYHEAEFARRDLGFYLPALYHDQADLIVVVVCRDYEQKEWCGLEWDAIFDLLKKRKNDDVMLCRFDNATVKGLYSTAGFVDLDGKTPELTATRILERLALNEGKPKNYYHLKRSDRSLLAASPPPLPRPTQGPSPPPGEPSWPKSWKPTFAVSVIGAAAVVGILLYTLRDHDGQSPSTRSSKIPGVSSSAPTSKSGPTPRPDQGKAATPGANPEAKSNAAELAGYVVDDATGQPVEGVELSLLDYDDINGKTPTCRTNPEGRFRFRDLPASPQSLQRVRLFARKEGYAPSDTYTSLGTTAEPVTLKAATTPEHNQ